MSKELDLLKEAVRILEEKEQAAKGTDNPDNVELSTLIPGDTFKIGEYDFVVLDQQRERTLVISKDFMAEDEVFDVNSRDYKTSSLKKLIENEIQPIIENAVGKENLVEHDVDLTSVDMQNEFGTCRCKVRPITFDEVRMYNAFLANQDLDDWWWTCSPWSTESRGLEYSITVVSPAGSVDCSIYSLGNGVRPFCILKSNIFVSKGE